MIVRIGISGKRDIDKTQQEEVSKAIENRIKQILAKRKVENFIGYTSLASGTDTLFAKIVSENFKMPLQLVLPMPVEEYKKDFSDQESLILHNYIKSHNNVVIVTSNLPLNGKERNDAYLNAGKYLVNNCDEMIFVWDELKPVGKGGTAEILGYYSESQNQIPVDYLQISATQNSLLDTTIQNEYDLSNNQAIKNSRNFKVIWKLAIFLGWLAVAVFAVNTSFKNSLSSPVILAGVCVEFVLVTIVFALIIKAKAKDYHGGYLKARIRAETLRVLKAFYHANIDINILDAKSLTDKDLHGLVKNINNEVATAGYSSKWYTNYVIKSLIHEQVTYHSAKEKSIGAKFHLWENINRSIASLFILTLFVHLIDELLHYFYHIDLSYAAEIATCASILLPASYAAVEGTLYFQEWSRLKKYSTSARESLTSMLNNMPDNLEPITEKDITGKQTVVLNFVASVMLTDNKYWNMIFEDKNNYHWVI